MLTAERAAASLAELRVREFSRLETHRQVYLDYTGSALYGESQIRAHHALLTATVFGNPHSEHGPSRASAAIIDAARQMVLRFFDVDAAAHDVIFTANTSAAIKLVAESYPFTSLTPCLLSADNHNSMNGIREYARRGVAPVRYLRLDGELRLQDPSSILAEEARGDGGLLAFPAQSNFSGVLHPLSLVAYAKSLGYDVLLDAAAYVPAHALSLRKCPADFTALSFYKLFGYPTGLGALIARHDALARLRRPWFAGGTVAWASVDGDTHRLRSGHDGFEDGTPSFLAIAALAPGFALLEEAGMARVTSHVEHLTGMFLTELAALRHGNRARLATIYGPRGMGERGCAVAFNIRGRDGSIIPYWVIEAGARRAGIALRGGCFCNPGASEAALGLDAERTAECLALLGDDFTPERFAACIGSPVGAVRVSAGLANDESDIHRAIAWLASLRV